MLANSGTSFEEYLGLVTAGTEITRDSDKVANGLKTISLRLQGMTDEGEEDLELMAKLGEAFSKINVNIMDSEGNMRSTYDILMDLSDAFKTMTPEMKAYYTELAAGKYQANVLTAILENFETATKATSEALYSNGSAIRENEVYMESIAGKMNMLTSEFQRLSQTTVESGLVKGLIDTGTALLKIANAAGGLTPIVVALVGVLLRIQGTKVDTFFKDALDAIVNFKEGLKTGESSISSFAGSITGMIGIVTTAVSVLISITNAVKAAHEEMIRAASEEAKATMETVSSIEALKVEYENIINSSDTQAEKDKQLTEFKKKLIEQYGFEKQAIDDVNDSRGEMIGLLDMESQKSVEKWLAENTSAYEEAIDKIESLSGSVNLTDIASTQFQGFIIPSDIQKTEDAVRSLNENFKDLGITFETTMDTIGDTYSGTEYEREIISISVESENLIDITEKLRSAIARLETKRSSASGLTREEASLLDVLHDKYDSAIEIVNEYQDTYENGNEIFAQNILLQNQASMATVDSKESFEEFKEEMLANAGASEGVREALEELIDNMFPQFVDSANDATDALNGLSDTVESLSLEKHIEQLEEISSAYSTLSNAVDEYNEKGYITIDTLTSLLSLDTEYLANLELVNGKLVMTNTSLSDQIEALKVTAFNELQAAAAADILALANGDINDMSDAAKSAISDMGSEIVDAGNKATTASGQFLGLAASAKATAEAMGANLDQEGIQEEVDAILGMYENIWDVFSNVKVGGTSYKSSGSSSSKGSTSSSKDTDPIEEQSKEFKEQIEILEHQLFLLEQVEGTEQKRINLLKKIQDTVQEQAEWYRKQGLDDNSEYIRDLSEQWYGYKDDITSIYEEIADKNSEAFQDRLSISEDYIDEKNFYDNWGADNEIAAWKRVLNWMKTEYYDKGLISWEEYAEAVKEVNENLYSAIQDAIEEAKDSQLEALETQKDALETTFDYMSEKIQNEIDLLQKQRDAKEEYWDAKIEALEEQNEEIEKQIELEEAQEALERAKSQKTMRVYYEGKGWVWEADRDAVKEAQDALDELERENQLEEDIADLEAQKDEALKIIDDQIEGWKKYKEEWSSVVDSYQDSQNKLIAEQVLGIKLEGDNWKTRIENLQSYIDQYNSVLSKINSIDSNSAFSGPSGNSFGVSVDNTPDIVNQMKENSDRWHSASDSEKEQLAAANESLGQAMGWHRGEDGSWYDSSGNKMYKDGGIVDYTGSAILHGRENKPEIVLNNSQAASLYNWIRTIPRYEITKQSQKSGYEYNFSGAVFNIKTDANNFDSLIKDIKVKIQNR